MKKERKFFQKNKKVYSVLRPIKDPFLRIKGFLGLGSYPDYIIIGTQKAGTTSLQYYLSQHSQVLSPLKKEIHFFDRNHDKGKKWYKAHFPLKRKNKKITGEATPNYLFFPKCAKKIRNLLPDVKIIIVLRNPVDRAYSHYNMVFNNNKEDLPFEEAIEREDGRTDKSRNRDYEEKTSIYSYIERGKYTEQLKRYFRYFDKNQILILSFEELKKNPQKETNKVFDFLGLKKEKIFPKIKYKGRYNSKMNPKTRKRLEEYFKPYNKELYDYLEKDFGW